MDLKNMFGKFLFGSKIFHFLLLIISMNDFSQARLAFDSGQYEKSSQIFEQMIENQQEFTHKTILKANNFIAKYLSSNEEIPEKDVDSMISLLSGIPDEITRKRSIYLFTKNVTLYYASHKNAELAFKFVEIAYQNDVTLESEKLYDSLCLQFKDYRINDRHSSFVKLWNSFVNEDYKNCLQHLDIADKCSSYIAGCCYLSMGHIKDALKSFQESINKKFRISDSLIGAGICVYKLKNIKQAMEYFTQAMRASSELSAAAIFNAAEVCGALQKYDEQTSLLQIYARLEIGIRKRGSIGTLYKLAKLSLQSGDAHSAVDRYQYIMDECKSLGVDLPSPSFIIEFAHALNLIFDYETAKSILDTVNPTDDLTRAVIAHTLFLSRNYLECEQLILGLETPDGLANQAILKYISGNERGAIQQLEQARRRYPNEKAILRTLVLIKFAKPQTVKSGCMTWLTYLGYQMHYESEFYEDVITRLTLAGSPDPVTISALKFIAAEKAK